MTNTTPKPLTNARWWRWLVMSGIASPGGGLAYHLVSQSED
jgi:hypothetical protein